MNLLVDLGNTRIKWAWARGGVLLRVGSAAHGRDDLGPVLEGVWGGQAPPVAVWAASVAGAALSDAFQDWCQRRWAVSPQLVTTATGSADLQHVYPHPQRLGVDRWVAMHGALGRVAPPCIVVDCGTAVTVDLVQPGPRHAGGAIFAGLTLSRRALGAGTGDLPLAAGAGGALPAAETRAAIAAGTREALAGGVERVVRDLAGQCRRAPAVLVTGGDGPALRNALPVAWRLYPELVLEGLLRLSQSPLYSRATLV